MPAGRPADYRDVVHPARRDTRVFIAARHPPCIRLRDEAARPKGRDDHTMLLDGFEELELPRRWGLAVIRCPGDTTEELVRRLAKHRADPGRVMFVVHPGTDAVAALRGGYRAGHDGPVVVEARTLKDFARSLGQFVNDWIYADAKGTGWPVCAARGRSFAAAL